MRMRILSVLCALAFSTVALAQSNLTTWNNWGGTESQATGSNTFTGQTSQTTHGGTNQVVRAQAKGTATQDSWIVTPDSSSFIYTREVTQSFTVNTPSVIQIPLYFKGAISYTDNTLLGGTNDSTGSAVGRFTLFDTSNNNLGSISRTLNSDAATTGGATSSINSVGVTTVNVPAGTYVLRGSMFTSGLSQNSNSAQQGDGNTGISTNFFDGTNGAATVLGAWPQGLGGSRAAVSAPSARTRFNVDGGGITVGMIETRRPYIGGNDPLPGHSALGGIANKVTITNAATAGQALYRGEHAQFVASIIAADDANTENAGIAPKARIRSASVASYSGANPFQQAFNDVRAGTNIINISFTTNSVNTGADPNGDNAFVNAAVNANPNLLVISAAGNNNANVTAPAGAYNGLTVGALNADFTRRASFSNFGSPTGSGRPRFKPDIVAPGEYINAAAPFGNGYTRAFMGETFDTTLGPQVGAIRGTSFSTPIVSGAAALVHEYGGDRGHEIDHRVIKALLMNGATTSVSRTGTGGAWAQQTNNGTLTTANPLIVLGPLDTQLGAGMLNVERTLLNYQPAEVRVSDNNPDQHTVIFDSQGDRLVWDREQVQPFSAALGENGTVDYLIGDYDGFLRSTLVWDVDNAGNVPNLIMRLYQEADTPRNPLGWDMNDQFIAEVQSHVFSGGTPVDQNTLLFHIPNVPDYTGPNFNNPFAGNYYISVQNLDTMAVTYGIAMIVPEPGLLVVVVMPILTLRRRR